MCNYVQRLHTESHPKGCCSVCEAPNLAASHATSLEGTPSHLRAMDPKLVSVTLPSRTGQLRNRRYIDILPVAEICRAARRLFYGRKYIAHPCAHTD